MGSYLIRTVGVDNRLVPQALLVGALFGCVSAFVTGSLTDRFGRRPVIIAVTGFLVVFPAPAFLMLDTGNTALIVLVIVLGFVFAAYGTVGSQAAAFAELAGSRSLCRCGAGPGVLGGARWRYRAAAVRGAGALFAGWIGVVIYMTAIMSISLVTAIGCRRPGAAI